jgi:glycosyltransferase involved in cell wall biosynthesis
MGHKVLVIMPTHNKADRIKYSIDSVLKQTYKDFDFAIVGDGVGDDTRYVVEEFKKIDSRITFYDNEKGYEKFGEENRDKVIKDFPDAKYITYLADDDLFIKNHIGVMLKEIKGYDFVHPFPMFVTHDNKNIFFDRYLDNKTDFLYIFNKPENNFISMTGAMHTRDIYDKTDGWTKTPKEYATDKYMWSKILSVPECRYKTSRKSTTIKLGNKHFRGTDDQELMLIKKWYSMINNDNFIDIWDKYILDYIKKNMIPLRPKKIK